MQRCQVLCPALALGLLLGVGPLRAAEPPAACEALLSQAEQSYRGGRLREALPAIRSCLDTRPDARIQIACYALLAKTHLALDERPAAADAIRSLLVIEPDFAPGIHDPPRFRRLVEEARGVSGIKVTSVSKTRESLREAPATVAVITAEQIERRGYLDLEAVLHDLPGFDISRTNGATYANVYQRGYRSPSTDRTLFLVDGVEHNGLTSNIAYLSRQYPLSHIERIEVIHGPASTMYGANAFAGVINVITKAPSALVGNDRNAGGRVLAGYGSWNTRYLDTSVAARSPSSGLSFSLTARIYRSDEPDLSGYPEWDYDPDTFDYEGVRGFSAAEAAQARQLDQAVLVYGGRPVAFSDPTDDWYVAAKLVATNLELGLHTWRRREGSTPWGTDQSRPGGDNGSLWTPEQTAIYVKYEREIRRDLSFFLFSRYKVHDLAPSSSTFKLTSYSNGRLDRADLVENREAYWEQTRLIQSSNQVRNEIGVVYEPSTRFNLVAGIELRNGSIQGDYVRVGSQDGEVPEVPQTTGGEHFDVRDLGAYAQISYRPGKRLRLVAGGRYDHNEIRQHGGYGSTFNPRLGLIFSPGRFVFKAIYAEAFKDASNFNKLTTAPGIRDLPNPLLEPEEVRNFELSTSWQAGDLALELAAYDARYTQVVGLRQVEYRDGTTGQFQNLGELHIRGMQATAGWRRENLDLYGNYTYTDPVNTEPLDGQGVRRSDIDELRVGDIAAHQVNCGANLRLRERFNVDLRLQWVGKRETGPNTTVPDNLERFDAHTVVHTAITCDVLVPGLDLQLVVNNLLDSEYFHPGLRKADNQAYASRIPQPRRSFFARLIYRF
ncbi:MAG: TonB-dependent receptor [bacterium]|nr:TonB-dependent receptor [bacterium]